MCPKVPSTVLDGVDSFLAGPRPFRWAGGPLKRSTPPFLNLDMPNESEAKTLNLKPGQVVRVHQKIREINPKGEEKERIQVFEGMVLALKGQDAQSRTITVRKISDGIGVEKIFPLNLPSLDKIEIVKRYKVRRAKLYYLRDYKKRLKEIKK